MVSIIPSPSASGGKTATPALPVLSKSLVAFGSSSSALTPDELSKAPTALIVACTVIVTSLAGLPLAILPIVHGKEVHPPPLTEVIVKFVGVSVTTTLFAVSGPTLETIIV